MAKQQHSLHRHVSDVFMKGLFWGLQQQVLIAEYGYYGLPRIDLQGLPCSTASL